MGHYEIIQRDGYTTAIPKYYGCNNSDPLYRYPLIAFGGMFEDVLRKVKGCIHLVETTDKIMTIKEWNQLFYDHGLIDRV